MATEALALLANMKMQIAAQATQLQQVQAELSHYKTLEAEGKED